MDLQERVKELLKPVGFRTKRLKVKYDVLKDLEQDTWEIKLTYKGKQMRTNYVAMKGQFKQPKLDIVLNAYFLNSHMYRNYDFFEISEMIGHGMPGGKAMDDFYKQLEGVHHELVKLFGDDFEEYDHVFKMVRPAHLMLDMDKKMRDRAYNL